VTVSQASLSPDGLFCEGGRNHGRTGASSSRFFVLSPYSLKTLTLVAWKARASKAGKCGTEALDLGWVRATVGSVPMRLGDFDVVPQ